MLKRDKGAEVGMGVQGEKCKADTLGDGIAESVHNKHTLMH